MGLRKGKKKNAQTPPSQAMPLPLPGMPMPPPGALPTPLPLPEAPAPLPLPEAPTPLPLPEAPAPLPLPDALTPAPEAEPAPEVKNEYGEMWAKRSTKPLQQIYGHIDRLAKKETGSLLDRYADRFGHSLDREIIVLRKKEHDSKISEIRDAPVVELLGNEDSGDLQSQLTAIEDELRALKPEYQAAKSAGDSDVLSQLRPVLESLMSERKSIMAMIDQSLEPTVAQEAVASDEPSEEDNLFGTFVAIVDDLLGSQLPEDVVSSFIQSENFAIYQQVGENPLDADDDMRSLFVAIVDEQLGYMSAESVTEFTQTEEFTIYESIATLYQ